MTKTLRDEIRYSLNMIELVKSGFDMDFFLEKAEEMEK